MERLKRNLIWAALVVIFVASVYLILALSIWFGYQEKVHPGVSVAGFSVGGMTEEKAKEKIDQITEGFSKKNPTIFVGEETIPTEDLEIVFDTEKTAIDAKRAVESPFSLGFQKEVPLVFSYNSEPLYRTLAIIDAKKRKPASNPEFILGPDKVLVTEARVGRRIVFGDATSEFVEAIGRLDNSFDVKTTTIKPTVLREDIKDLLPQIAESVESGLVLEGGGISRRIGEEELVSWIVVRQRRDQLAKEYFKLLNHRRTSVEVDFSREKIESHLKEVALEVDSEPVDATLRIEDGRAVVFSLAKDGRKLNIEESLESVFNSLEVGEKKADLKIELKKAKIRDDTIDELGITELVGSGYSDFAGSPANRRHNIRVGAERFNGLLIEPDEVFSFTANMGKIDAASGYLPELVIIDRETRPEYGGGVCQISTTTFRAALNAGFPIITRRPHSYPVQYYRPYGADAAVYRPSPDLRFKNNTPAHVLIQTRVVGNRLFFDFYGTKTRKTVKFAGNKDAVGAVDRVENVTPYTYDHGGRGPGSFKAVIYRFFYDREGKLTESEYFFSNYDSPDKYPQ